MAYLDSNSQKALAWFKKYLSDAKVPGDTPLRGMLVLNDEEQSEQRDPFGDIEDYTVEQFLQIDFEESSEDNFEEMELLDTIKVLHGFVTDGLTLSFGQVKAKVQQEQAQEQEQEQHEAEEHDVSGMEEQEAPGMEEEAPRNVNETVFDKVDDPVALKMKDIAVSKEEMKDLREFGNALSYTLGKMNLEHEDVKHGVIPADLADPKTWGRLQCLNDKGQVVPMLSEESIKKLAGGKESARLQALKALREVVKERDVFLRDEENLNSLYELKQTKSGVPYRGELVSRDRGERDVTQFAGVQDPLYRPPHGKLTMIFMRLLQSMGVDWFNAEIAEQEHYDRSYAWQKNINVKSSSVQRADRLSDWYAREREMIQLEESLKGLDTNAVLEQSARPRWAYVLRSISNAAIIPGSKVSVRIFDYNRKGLDSEPDILGAVIGIMGRPAESEKDEILAEKFLTSLLNRETVLWKDPEMREFIEKGLDHYERAQNVLKERGKGCGEHMQQLICGTMERFGKYADTMYPLDSRVMALGSITKAIGNFSRKDPDLHGDMMKQAMIKGSGVVQLGMLVREGLEAQYKLACGDMPAMLVSDELGRYLAYKAAENMAGLQKAQGSHLTKSGGMVDMLGKYGRNFFQQQCRESTFVTECTKGEDDKVVENCARVAADGFVNGNKSVINRIGHKTALSYVKAMGAMNKTNLLPEGENAVREQGQASHENREKKQERFMGN